MTDRKPDIPDINKIKCEDCRYSVKGDLVFVDEDLHRIQIVCGPDVVKMTINWVDWQATMCFRREDPDLRTFAEALLACCEVTD